jgi:molybdate transport system permease protein
MLDFSAAEIEAVHLSLRIAFWAVVGSLPFGLATAIVLARGRFYGKSLLDGVVHLPLVMPPVVTGYLLFAAVRSSRTARPISRRIRLSGD